MLFRSVSQSRYRLLLGCCWVAVGCCWLLLGCCWIAVGLLLGYCFVTDVDVVTNVDVPVGGLMLLMLLLV